MKKTVLLALFAVVACASPTADQELDDPAAAEILSSQTTGPIENLLGVVGVARNRTRARVEAAHYQVTSNEGYPLRSDTRWVIMTRWPSAPSAGSVYWVSDLNGWSTTSRRATRVGTLDYYYVILNPNDFVGDARGARYKWYSNGTYRAPTESRTYGEDAYGEFGYVSPPVGVRYLERFPDLRSNLLANARTVRMSVPAGFEAQSNRRVLVLQDGQNLFSEEVPWGGWRVQDALGSAFSDVLVVGIDNAADRFDVYTNTGDSYSGVSSTGSADAYLSWVESDVLPRVRVRYGITHEPSRWAVGGSSLGGLVSLYMGEHSRSFGYVMAMSATLGWGSYAENASPGRSLVHAWTRNAADGDLRIYLDSGGGGNCYDRDGDGVQEDADDDDNYCVTLQMRDRLHARGYNEPTRLRYRHLSGAPHNEAAWADRFPDALSALADLGWRR